MHSTLVPVWVAALGMCAAQSSSELTPEIRALVKIKMHMRETLARQPNYTCMEQIDRSLRHSAKRKYDLLDTVRLEVGLVDGKELFAWPGSTKFEEGDLEKMVAGGAIGNGNFALFARGVFESNAPRFQFVEESDVKGRRALQYAYTVSQLQSGFRLRVGRQEAVVAYHGSFWADAETYDVSRLDVIADDIPAALGLEHASTRMEYARVKIGAGEFLLPAASEMWLRHMNGDENYNRIQLKGCRQYLGESVLKFDAADEPAPAVSQAGKQELQIPAELMFDVTLADEIDSARSMVGDPVRATLMQGIKHNRRILFPKGAAVAGRILRLERRGEYCFLELRFSELESEDRRATMAAVVDEIQMGPASGSSPRAGPAGTFSFRATRVHLGRGIRLRLHTLSDPLPPQTMRK